MPTGDWADAYLTGQRGVDARRQEQRVAADAERERLAANEPEIITRLRKQQQLAREALLTADEAPQ